jgi:hypothetical protein
MRSKEMKKLLLAALLTVATTVACTQVALADNAAKIKINIKGAMKNNNYFLCIPTVGCLSIKAAQRGKVYPIYHPIDLGPLYVLDVNNNFRATGQVSKSCITTVDTNQTVTISGSLSSGKNGKTVVNQLRCSVS